jgi:hypothetical protein
MPPAPARIASTPMQNGMTSWKPAVPPPPVPGAALGNELADGLRDGDGDGLRLGLGLGVVVLGVVVLGVLPELLAPGVPPAEVVGVVGPVPPGDNEVGVVDGEPAVQADTNAGATMAKAAQPRTVPRKRHRPYR